MNPRDTILRLAHEPGDVLLPDAPDADDRAGLDAWLDERAAHTRDAIDADATPDAFRDDGTLWHDRLPSEDCDPFNPCIVARAEAYPPCAADHDSVPAWAYQTAGRA